MTDDHVNRSPEDPPSDSAARMLQVLSVSELTRCIRGVIEAEDLFRDVWVRGEVSNLTKHSSGHVYFSLKDDTSILRCVMWNGAARMARFRMEEGMRVIANGRVTVYEKAGQYQFVVAEATPDGVGALYVAFEQLKSKLAAEGLFDQARKKPIPAFPSTIAIITSPTAAALRDMVSVARRRMPSVNLLLVPTVMQGDDSESSVVQSLALAESLPDVDVIVIGRGGGSIEDLWSFNTESVARAIFGCRKPVVSAIGHETDYTLADMVADLRAPTPSAAMELIVPDRDEVIGRIRAMYELASASVSGRFARSRGDLEGLMASPSMRYPERLLQSGWQALDASEVRLKATFEALAFRCGARLGEASARLDGLSPLAVLGRGYGVARHPDGRVIRQVSDVRTGETMETLLADGTVVSEVTDVRKGWN